MTPLKGSRFRPTRQHALVLGLLTGLSLTGCSSWNLPNVLYLSLSTNSDQTIDATLLQDYREKLSILNGGYRQIHPSTYFQFSLYPEERIIQAMQRRTGAGLGPDVLFVNGETAKRLVAQRLADPFPINAALAQQLNPEDLQRMRITNGALAGLPILIQTQVACFNRKHLSQAPTTLQALLSASAKGHRIGLSIELTSLFWSAGSMGAVDAVQQLESGQTVKPDAKNSLTNWLSWLQNANHQQRVTFYANQSAALNEFRAGHLDWIPCSSVSLPSLRKTLGESLGVASLPSGPGGMASPINRLRVFALGRSSSQAGRERAIAFSRFAVNPLVQHNLTVGAQTVLPANRFVKVPTQSSGTLKALSASKSSGQRSAAVSDLLHQDDPRIISAQSIISSLVFGEVSPNKAANDLIHLFQKER